MIAVFTYFFISIYYQTSLETKQWTQKLLSPTQREDFTEWLMLEGISVGHCVPHACSSRDTQSHLPRTVSRHFYSISKDLHNPLGNLGQCLVTLRVKKCFLFRQNLCFSLCPLPWVLALGITEKSLTFSSLYPLFRMWGKNVFIYINQILPEPSLLQDEQ